MSTTTTTTAAATYYYVVLRLAPNQMRGEIINAGIALFSPQSPARVITMATLNKLRAIDNRWDTPRLERWTSNAQSVLDSKPNISRQIKALSTFGFCPDDAPLGSFIANTAQELTQQLQRIKNTYVSNKIEGAGDASRPKRVKLQTALRDKFRGMNILGSKADDLANHLVVPNVPVPGHSELRTDFVYKNGVYRLTQTLDYHIAPDSLHSKLGEACIKATAADLAAESYGQDTMRLAVVDVPKALLDAVKAHLDLLQHKGFEVFHFDDRKSMSSYLAKAAPAHHP